MNPSFRNKGILLAAVSLLFVLLSSLSPLASAKGVYQTGPEFIDETFSTVPDKQSLWLTPDVKIVSAKILGRDLKGARIRYWYAEEKTAWILEEIGKELPITIGVVINDSGIDRVKILTYRETRGGEVRYHRFLRQFVGGNSDEDGRIDRSIDGITGATLSVRAVTRVCELALYFDSLVRRHEAYK